MLPGKRYTPEVLLSIARRRMWYLIVPLAVVTAATATYARRIPDSYWAETVILVVPQRVPEAYVKSTVTERIEDRLQTITPTILSRTRLERIITDFNLYPEERRTGPMEDVVALMRRNVTVDVKRGDSFSITYIGNQPEQVMQVTNRLASLFIDESLRDRRSQAEGTDKFLEAELQDAKEKLLEKEKRLETYRKEHAGELPSQLVSNLQQVENAQMRVSDTRDSINRDRDRRLVLEQQLAELQKPVFVETEAGPATGQAPDASGSTQQQLAQAQAQVEAYQARGLKAGHPDLEQAKRRVRDLQAKLVSESSGITASAPRVISPAEAERRRRVSDLQAQMAELDRQIGRKQDDEKRLQAAAEEAQRRADALPTRESELTELTRDYATLQNSYNSLLAKKQDSQIAANLEDRQIGEQFKLLDPARLPEKPFRPDRRSIDAMGAGVGLALGLVIVGLLEYRDRSFRTDEDLAALVGLPVLAVIPVMMSDADRQRARWQAFVTHGALGGVVLTCVGVFLLAVVR
jgi:polysaccharide chain length determinant protein (PEP-CTERM system associated)